MYKLKKKEKRAYMCVCVYVVRPFFLFVINPCSIPKLALLRVNHHFNQINKIISDYVAFVTLPLTYVEKNKILFIYKQQKKITRYTVVYTPPSGVCVCARVCKKKS